MNIRLYFFYPAFVAAKHLFPSGGESVAIYIQVTTQNPKFGYLY